MALHPLMQASQLFPLAFSPKICLGFFYLPPTYRQGDSVLLDMGIVPELIQLLFHFKGFIINSQLYSLARGREGKHSFSFPTGFR